MFKQYPNKSSIKKLNSRMLQGGTPEVLQTSIGWWERNVKLSQESSGDLMYTIPPEYAGRADLISFAVYGSAEYSWVVLQRNSIVDIIDELSVGKTIMLPSFSKLKLSILNKSTR